MRFETHQNNKRGRRRKRSVTIEDQTMLRQTIIDVARQLLAAGGFRAATMKAIAGQAHIATGTVYLYFPSKADLFAEVFRVVSGREVQAVTTAAEGVQPAIKALEAAVQTFVDRAIRGRRMAYALIAEPVDPAIEVERLVSRHAFAQVFADVIRSGIAWGTAETKPGYRRSGTHWRDQRGARTSIITGERSARRPTRGLHEGNHLVLSRSCCPLIRRP